jgi:hypothetical protein
MAFDSDNFYPISAGAGAGTPKIISFVDTASTKAQIAAADYFLTKYQVLNVNDFIMAAGSDGCVVLAVTASTSATVTTEEATLL